MPVRQAIDAANFQAAADRQSMNQAATCIMQTGIQGNGVHILTALRSRNYRELSIGGGGTLGACINCRIAADWEAIANQESSRQPACYRRALMLQRQVSGHPLCGWYFD
jgi:hypothetical protein